MSNGLKNQINKMEALINFAMQDRRISKVIFGVTSVKELEEILININVNCSFENLPKFSNDLALLDPRKW